MSNRDSEGRICTSGQEHLWRNFSCATPNSWNIN